MQVVATAITAVLKAGVSAVMMAGKAVAAGLSALGGAMDSVFRVERIFYSGSLLQAFYFHACRAYHSSIPVSRLQHSNNYVKVAYSSH